MAGAIAAVTSGFDINQIGPELRAGSDESAALIQVRESGQQRYAELGWPGRKLEAWRFTESGTAPVDPLPSQVELTDPATLPAALGAGGPRLVFINGRFNAGLSTVLDQNGVHITTLAELPGDLVKAQFDQLPGLADHPFAALNSALFTDVAVVHVAPEKVLDQPVQLIYRSQGEGFSYPRCLVICGAGAQVEVVEEFSGDDGSTSCPVTEITLAAGARCDYYRVQQSSGRQFGGMRVLAGEDARFSGHCVSIAGRLSRVDVDMVLAGTGSDCEIRGLALVTDGQVADYHVRAIHDQPGGTSRQIFRSVVEGASRAVFDGLIKVVKDAQKSDASQNTRSLLLSPKGIANAMPRLEILADDVKCAHGATAGFLDPDALFYLRSRGFGAEQARALLIHAFAREQLDAIGCAPLRERLTRLVAARFGDSEDAFDVG